MPHSVWGLVVRAAEVIRAPNAGRLRAGNLLTKERCKVCRINNAVFHIERGTLFWEISRDDCLNHDGRIDRYCENGIIWVATGIIPSAADTVAIVHMLGSVTKKT